MDVYTKGYTMCEPVIVLTENQVPQNCTLMQYLSKCCVNVSVSVM